MRSITHLLAAPVGTGGRAFGHGIYITGNDVDDVVLENCSVDNTFGDNVRYQGDQDGDENGAVTIKQCYLHHSKTAAVAIPVPA